MDQKKFEKKLTNSIHFLKNKAKCLDDIHKNARYIITDEFTINPEDLKLIDDKSKKIINDFSQKIEKSKMIDKEILEKYLNELMDKYHMMEMLVCKSRRLFPLLLAHNRLIFWS